MLVENDPSRLEVQLLFAPSHRRLKNMEDTALEVEPFLTLLPDPDLGGVGYARQGRRD